MWAGRILALLMAGGVGIVVSALIVRVLRPSNLRGFAGGDLPALRKARFTVFGQMIEVDDTVDANRDERIEALERRADATDEHIDRLDRAVDVLMLKGGAGYDERK